MSRVLVRFKGEGSGVGEPSWGQREMWGNIQRYSHQLSLAGCLPVPEGTTVEDIAAELEFQVSRHQSLRTRFRFDESGRLSQQVVSDRGEIHLEIVDSDGEDPAEVGNAVQSRLRDTVFDLAEDWPVRMAVVRHHGVLTHVAAAYCHVAVDGSGMLAMLADLAGRDPDTGSAGGPVTATQPLEQARDQSGAASLRLSEFALRYWERVLRSAPAQRFRDGGGLPDGQNEDARFVSPAIRAALRMIATRRGRGGTPPVLLAAYAVALARTTGRNPSVARVIVGNRFRPGLAETVSNVTQSGLCAIDVAGISFEQAVKRAWQSSINTYKYAYYDPARRDELVAALGLERGEPIDLSCFINDRRDPDGEAADTDLLTPEDLRALASRTTLSWMRQPYQADESLFINAGEPEASYDDPADAVVLTVRADTRRIAPSDVEALLRGIESVLLEAALDPDPDATTGVA